MRSLKNKITFKVLIGYIILGVLATFSGVLLLREIKTFTSLQKQDILDRSKIVKTGGLIADLYENESLARAAIQLNSTKKFNEYVYENEQLLLKIDSLNAFVENGSQKFILDSIKLFINKKLENITDLKNLKQRDNSDESIKKAIKKLSSIDSLLGKGSITDLVANPEKLNKKTRKNLEEYVSILNKYNPKGSINKMGQKQIDSLLSISKNMLKEVQVKSSNQRQSLLNKEHELIENDLIIFRKLQELLSALERDIIQYASNINTQRDKTLNHSKNIIFFAAGVSFIIIVIFSIIFFNDFWKTQRYRKQLEEANKTTTSLLNSREQLISMVSHDLRTPLSTISGFSELLLKSTHNVKDKNYIEHINNASVYMAQLVDDLLEFSKLEHGNITIESIPFNLQKHINDIIDSVKNSVQKKPIKIVVKHDKSIRNLIIGDPFRMKQILYNLIINAYKFTNEGSITIESVLGENNTLEIQVTDTGIGISENQQENIFKAFTQANTIKANGFGLGLTISKKLIELLGGTLTLKSQLRIGSTFSLKMPVTFSNTLLNVSKETKTNNVFNLKAVVVEDDITMRKLLKDLLKQHGIEAYIFENAKKALERMDAISYNFVLTDIQLPKMNGIQFMETLKNQKYYKSQPIIAMTGRANTLTKDYINNGFSEVLIKPFGSDRIESVLNQFFSDEVLKSNTTNINEEIIHPDGFSIASIGAFLNNDTVEIKKTLSIFLEDTKNNYSLLKQANKNKDIDTFNNVSHKMLSMFKQLEVSTIVPFLEKFEVNKTIKNEDFNNFKTYYKAFIISLENYLN